MVTAYHVCIALTVSKVYNGDQKYIKDMVFALFKFIHYVISEMNINGNSLKAIK